MTSVARANGSYCEVMMPEADVIIARGGRRTEGEKREMFYNFLSFFFFFFLTLVMNKFHFLDMATPLTV